MADIHKPLTIAALSLMVVGIGFTLANAWFFFLADPEAPLAAPAATAGPETGGNVSVAEIAALHLFGRPRARPGAATDIAATENLRETRLSLALVGVFVSAAPDESRALIAQKGRQPETYVPGDRLPGNAKLVDVYWNRVVISRAGQHELIRFDHDTGSIKRTGGSAPQDGMPPDAPNPARGSAVVEAARPQGAAPDARRSLSRYREEFEQDPEKLLRDVGVGFSDDKNSTDGYVVGALADLPELSHTGLQPGDRILSVNGSAVGDPTADRLKIEDFLADGAARLEIQRGDRRFVVTVAVN